MHVPAPKRVGDFFGVLAIGKANYRANGSFPTRACSVICKAISTSRSQAMNLSVDASISCLSDVPSSSSITISARTTLRSLVREADVRAMLKEGGVEPGNRLSFVAADLSADAG
jgi:hypothetical protein